MKRKTTAAAQETPDDLAARKRSHLDLCTARTSRSSGKTTLLEEVDFVHDALPELALDEVDARRALARQATCARRSSSPA